LHRCDPDPNRAGGHAQVDWYPDRPGLFRVNFGNGTCDYLGGGPIARACTSFMHVTVDVSTGTVIGVDYESLPV